MANIREMSIQYVRTLGLPHHRGCLKPTGRTHRLAGGEGRAVRLRGAEREGGYAMGTGEALELRSGRAVRIFLVDL